MRPYFFDIMHDMMDKYPNVYFIFIGLGYPRVDEFIKKYPDRVINTEASEQTALDIAVGLSYSGKIPVLYTITPFYLRAFETIRTYIDHENLHVIMTGSGRDDDYSKEDGFSHDATDIQKIFKTLPNIQQYYPPTKEDIPYLLESCIKDPSPYFISLRR